MSWCVTDYFVILQTPHKTISMKLKQLERSANQAIKNLRKEKLKNGLTFMINSDRLPSNQCYLEYPNGSIHLVFLSRKANDFEVIQEYSHEESDMLRKEFKLA